jgi:hypothetical protein
MISHRTEPSSSSLAVRPAFLILIHILAAVAVLLVTVVLIGIDDVLTNVLATDDACAHANLCVTADLRTKRAKYTRLFSFARISRSNSSSEATRKQ